MSEPTCVICGATIPQTVPPRLRRTCSAACRYTLNRMRWKANHEAAAERRMDERKAKGQRICAECNAPIPWERNLHCNTCSDTCRTNRDRRQLREREQKKRAERAAAPVRTVRVKVTYPKTGVTRWEDRPLVPYTGSAAQHEARRRGAAAAHAAQRGAAPWEPEVEDE